MTTAISPQAETVLAHRYYLKDKESKPLETADDLFRRVAHAIAAIEAKIGAAKFIAVAWDKGILLIA